MTSVVLTPFSTAWDDERAASAGTAQTAAVADPFIPIYRRGDRVVAWMVVAHLVLAGLLAPVYDTWLVTAVVGIGGAALYYLCMGFAGGRFVTRNVAGLALQTFCALHIYQMRGLAEMHFFFFTAVTAMIVYQDWRAMWLGVLAIIAQHILFSLWHNSGVHPGGQHFFEPDRVSLLKISFHFGIALVQVAFAAWCAHILRKSTERSFALAAANERLQEWEGQLETHNDWLVDRAASLEEKLRQSQKMDAIGKLAGGVAHDFNNILMLIRLHADLALAPGRGEGARRADIENIRRDADNAEQLTRRLLTLGRRQVLAPSAIELNAAIGNLSEVIRRLVGDKVEVSIVAGPDLASIWADAGQIQQVLLNLTVNARDAMPNGGRLTITTANVTARQARPSPAGKPVPPGDCVLLTVEDTGVGMAEDVRARIFEPFFTTKEVTQGSGLGLATVEDIVKQSGGHVWVQSEPGAGTTFKLLFPTHQPTGNSSATCSV
jgi:signal transduction histidine kinase